MVCSKCGYDPEYFAVCEGDFFFYDGYWYCLNCYEEFIEKPKKEERDDLDRSKIV